MKSNDLLVNFIANAGVKDIVGRGLIYSDNIAIIELVKNSKDASSSKVDIRFDGFDFSKTEINQESSITIMDYGKGMDLDDIKGKWLNIAYSEKRKATDKRYAGNKGVGRFSCDRLGRKLYLYTKSIDGAYLKLEIDWTKFENKDKKDEISTIQLEVEILEKDVFEYEVGCNNFNHGTVLVIKELRSYWSEKNIKNLISELEKFSPSLDNDFEVYFYSDSSFKDKDLELKVNRKINNNILDKLVFKTTYIKSEIDSGGKFIITRLFYQGDEIYYYKAKNPYVTLAGISVEIHYLDTISKRYFTRNIGVSANNYGSIFLFYNGFRISPYGNEKNDWLNLDQRKSQGTSRNLGTRDVIGRIDVTDDNNTFSVITSREGLANNAAYYDLVAFDPEEKTKLKNGNEEYGYVSFIIRQLETFVVDGLNWNRLLDRLKEKKIVSAADAAKDPDRYFLKEISPVTVKSVIEKIISNSFDVVDFHINGDLILEIKSINDRKYEKYIEEFTEAAASDDIDSFVVDNKHKVKKIIESLKHERDVAQQEQVIAEELAEASAEEAVKVTSQLARETKRSNFLERLVDPDKTLDALITHVIQQISGGIEKDAKSILSAYYNDPDSVSKDELIEVIENAAMDIALIKETSNMATKANFNLKVASIKEDLYSFVQGYIEKVASRNSKWGVEIIFDNPDGLERVLSFKPSEVCVYFVNIIDNASKLGAKKLEVICEDGGILCRDNGPGFDFKNISKEDYLRKGISTTFNGTGLGLFHCQEIANSLNAKVELSNVSIGKGAEIKLVFNDEN